MKLGFVAGLVDAETDWVVNTARKFSEHFENHRIFKARKPSGFLCSDEIVVEFHQEHEWLEKLRLQARNKRAAEKKLREFCQPKFGLHIPWEPKKSYRVIDKKFNDKDLISWLRFCVDNDIEFVNMHVEWDDGVKASEWSDDPAIRDENIEIAAENLKNIFSFVETNGIKLSLETLPSCLFVEKYGAEYAGFPAFPDDYLKLRKISGFDFGINPDVCHASITWHNMQNDVKPGVYADDLGWRKLSLEKFLEKSIKISRPIHQIHVADFLGYNNPSQHAIALGTGMLTDEAIKTVLKSVERKTALILEIKEDWETEEWIKKSGFLPETIKSLEKLSTFI